MEMYKPDFENEYAPHFTSQINPEKFSIIDFEYIGTMNSAIYLAHETGHAIADDIQREKGLSFRDFTVDELEEQAYFVQSIFEQYMEDNGALYGVNYIRQTQDELQTSWQRAIQSKLATLSFERTVTLPQFLRSAEAIKILSGKKDDIDPDDKAKFELTSTAISPLPNYHM